MKPFDYHASTKHSYYSVRTNPNRLDWNNQPSVYKTYPQNYKRIELDYNNENHRLFILSAGITAKKSYPGVEYYLRINPSAGALYPNEIYFQSRNQEGFENGIYHYEVSTNSVVLLQELDDNGIESYLGFEQEQEGFIILISSIYYRSSWKYKNRAFRYCLLDAGHLLGSFEACSYLLDRSYSIKYDFDKRTLNKMFGFEKQEFFSAAFCVTTESKTNAEPIMFELPFVNGSGVFEQNELIEFAYEQTLKVEPHIQEDEPIFNFNKNVLEETMIKRRSIRECTKQAISKQECEIILEHLNQSIKSDCDEEVSIYYVINRVKDKPLGAYLKDEAIKEGDYQKKAGYLCLEQDLGSSSAMTFFLTSKAKNYQALYQKAGIIGHRLYLVANYLGIGCSGIGAYYDDEVNEFLDNDEMVLYALAIGN